MNALALTLNWAADLSYFERNPAEGGPPGVGFD